MIKKKDDGDDTGSSFKSFGFSRQQQQDCFVVFQLHHVLDNQMYSHVYHCIDELHNKVHHNDIQILKESNLKLLRSKI